MPLSARLSSVAPLRPAPCPSFSEFVRVQQQRLLLSLLPYCYDVQILITVQNFDSSSLLRDSKVFVLIRILTPVLILADVAARFRSSSDSDSILLIRSAEQRNR